MTNRVSILGIPVDAVTLPQAVSLMRQMLVAPGRHHVTTPNPEMIVAAGKNRPFFDLLQRTALNVPDGAGLLWAAGGQLPQRVTGIDLLTALCDTLDASSPIFLLGAAPGVAEQAAVALEQRHPSLKVAGTHSGSPRPEEESSIVDLINASGAKILFVAYGAPAQDLWIDRNLPKMTSVSVAMGVGGAFDFLAGRRKRAPRIFQSLGIEWLWRFIQEPRRIGRIFTATVVFPLLVLRHRIGMQ